jgi:hypothetical protein
LMIFMTCFFLVRLFILRMPPTLVRFTSVGISYVVT